MTVHKMFKKSFKFFIKVLLKVFETESLHYTVAASMKNKIFDKNKQINRSIRQMINRCKQPRRRTNFDLIFFDNAWHSIRIALSSIEFEDFSDPI